MTDKKCALAPSKIKNLNRIQMAILESKNYTCQFTNTLPPKYEYEGENFCLLHLPYQTKKEKKLLNECNETINWQITNGTSNFNFIVTEDLKIKEDITIDYLSFLGAWIWSIRLENIKNVKVIDLSFSKINGVSVIKNCTFDRLYIKNSEVHSYLEFNTINARDFIINGNYFYFDKKMLRLDEYNYGLIVENSKIINFIFSDNTCELILKFSNCDINKLNFVKTKFFICPMISKAELNNLKYLTLPRAINFELKKFNKQYASSKPEVKSNAWLDQYRKFREIYSLTKSRDMYLEQSDYFYLMQYCLEKNSDTPVLLSFCSRIYRWFSNYGQSIVRPIFGLGITLFAAAFFFSLFNAHASNAFLLSIQQIIKPYSFLYDTDQQAVFKSLKYQSEPTINTLKPQMDGSYPNQIQLYNYFPNYNSGNDISGWVYSISILESTFSLMFLAFLLLALRWNFRKA